ncbi:hypothetical protein BJ912DRAFT_1129116 [Pholiota molesta]|nr:hypothetical protein BJ912DRAFT_1129116 [Pholiota molesta]
MPKSARKKSTSTTRKAAAHARPQRPAPAQKPTIKTEDAPAAPPPEEPIHSPTLSPHPMHPAHFDELAAIWGRDPRVPSVTSRRAWALARALDPASVHRWWYRRRAAHEKMFRVRLPLDAYELDVGVPPVIVFKVEDDDEKVGDADPLSEPVSADTCVDAASAGLSDNTLGSGIDSASLAKSVHILGKDVEKGAYIHLPSSPTLRFSSRLPSSPQTSPHRRRLSSLPPSSPPPPLSSPPPARCSLFLPTSESGYDSGPACLWLDDVDRERALPLLPEHHTDLKSCASAPVVPLPRFFCGSFAECYDLMLMGAADADGRHAADLDLEALRAACEEPAPWCLAGMRIAYDGSLVGVCSWCDVEMLTPSAG